MQYCRKTVNIPLFFVMLEQMFAHFETRLVTINQEDFLEHCKRAPPPPPPSENSKPSSPYRFEFGNPSLGLLDWKVSFDSAKMKVTNVIVVSLSPEGKKMAEECNFPPEFIDRGHCTDWSAKTHLKNVIRLAQLQQS